MGVSSFKLPAQFAVFPNWQPEPAKTNDNEIKRGKRNREMCSNKVKFCVNIPSKTGNDQLQKSGVPLNFT